MGGRDRRLLRTPLALRAALRRFVEAGAPSSMEPVIAHSRAVTSSSLSVSPPRTFIRSLTAFRASADIFRLRRRTCFISAPTAGFANVSLEAEEPALRQAATKPPDAVR